MTPPGASAIPVLDLPRDTLAACGDSTQKGHRVVASGSNNRRRQHQTLVRWNRQEWRDALAKADALGLSLPDALRSLFLGIPASPQKHTPAQNKKLSELLGHCGKIGSNLNQLSRALEERGETGNKRLKEARAAYPLIRTAIRVVLDPDTKAPPPDNTILAALIADAAGIGHDINRIARTFNTGRAAEYNDTLIAYLKLRDAILSALPIEPGVPPANDHKGK